MLFRSGDFWGAATILNSGKLTGMTTWSNPGTPSRNWYVIYTPKTDHPVKAWRDEAGLDLAPYYIGAALLGTAMVVLLAVLRAITRARDESIRTIEARYRFALNHAPTGVILANDKAIIELANTTLCRLLGYTDAQMIGMSMQAVLPGSKLQRHLLSADPTIKSDTQATFFDEADQSTLFARHQDGHLIPIEVTVAPSSLPDRKAMVVTVSDVRDRKSTRLNSSHSQQSRMPSSA